METAAADPQTAEEDRLNRAFAALSDPLRRRLVARLAQGDATVNELAEPFAVTLQAVSKHLKVLEEAGLITRSRDAQRRPCHLDAAALGRLTAWLDGYRQAVEERYGRLDALLASEENHHDQDQDHPGQR